MDFRISLLLLVKRKIPRLLIRQKKIRLICRLRKERDQALISMSIIQEFSALRTNLKNLRCSNIRRSSNMVGSAGDFSKCFEILASAQLEPVQIL